MRHIGHSAVQQLCFRGTGGIQKNQGACGSVSKKRKYGLLQRNNKSEKLCMEETL
jgi:hypothetical protein